MELMLELTRRCNMQCTHCLRGDAEALDMPRNIMWAALRNLEYYSLGLGGGESILNTKILSEFFQTLLYSDGYKNAEHLWIVTNGRRLYKELWQDEVHLSEYPDLTNSIYAYLLKISRLVKIDLAISIDRWHEDEQEEYYRYIKNTFEAYSMSFDEISVCKHGPNEPHQLINMGRTGPYNGKELDLDRDFDLLYVNALGDIYPSCDLSYSFMDTQKGTAIWLGNVLTHTWSEIQERVDYLRFLISESENNCVYLTELGCPELEELETEHPELPQEYVYEEA